MTNLISFLDDLRVIHVVKREKPIKYWEPIFISDQGMPWFDERLNWEGYRDKMSHVRNTVQYSMNNIKVAGA